LISIDSIGRGVRSVALDAGIIAAGESCAISIDVQARQHGELDNTSGALTSFLPATTDGASATLTVNQDPLDAGMSFEPAVIGAGAVSRLLYELRNDSVIRATSVAFSDTLPADVVVAAEPDARTTCTGGAVAAAPGADTITLQGGTLRGRGQDAEASCTVSLNVTSAAAGEHRNQLAEVTSSLGTSGASGANAPPVAEATLTVVSVVAPGFARAFSPTEIDPGGVSRLSYTIDNTVNAIGVQSLTFTDTLPDGLSLAGAANATTTCGGAATPMAATATSPPSPDSLAFTGGQVAAGRSCVIAVDVQAVAAGALQTLPVELFGELSNDPAADTVFPTAGDAATLTVNQAPLSVAMAFSPAAIIRGGISTLSYTLDNSAAVEATAVNLSDTLPADLTIAMPPATETGAGPTNADTTCTTGALTAVAGADAITFIGGALAAGASCAISVDVTSTVAASYPNETGSLTSSLGDSAPAGATLTVNPAVLPGFARVFEPATVDPGEVTTLIYTIDNSANLIAVGSLAFDDILPANLIVAGTPDVADNTCGGTFAAVAGGNTLSLAGGEVAAGESCTIAVDMQALRVGSIDSLSGELTSDLPDAAPGAAATLTVNEAPLTLSMAFSPPTITGGGVSTLTYTLENTAAVAASEVLVSDSLPPGSSFEGGCRAERHDHLCRRHVDRRRPKRHISERQRTGRGRQLHRRLRRDLRSRRQPPQPGWWEYRWGQYCGCRFCDFVAG